jgi:hypothetical protein
MALIASRGFRRGWGGSTSTRSAFDQEGKVSKRFPASGREPSGAGHVEGVARSARGSKQAEGGRGESNGERRAFANGDKLKESEWSRENHLRSFTTRKDALDAIEESWRRGPGCFELACLSGSCPGRACFFRTATGISIYIYCLGVFSRPGVMPGVAGRHFFAGSARKRAVSSRWSGGYTG